MLADTDTRWKHREDRVSLTEWHATFDAIWMKLCVTHDHAKLSPRRRFHICGLKSSIEGTNIRGASATIGEVVHGKASNAVGGTQIISPLRTPRVLEYSMRRRNAVANVLHSHYGSELIRGVSESITSSLKARQSQTDSHQSLRFQTLVINMYQI